MRKIQIETFGGDHIIEYIGDGKFSFYPINSWETDSIFEKIDGLWYKNHKIFDNIYGVEILNKHCVKFLREDKLKRILGK